jgi:ribosomal protein S18 acetylase RimI-like enzyme
MSVEIETLHDVTSEVVVALNHLLPQLSRSAGPLDTIALAKIIAQPGSTLLVARENGVRIVGMLTLVTFPIPTGIRAWIEDVVVDDSVRGQGVGTALTQEAIDIAKAIGAHTIDLTSRPSREAAHRLYEKLGFEIRDTRVYRLAEG